MLHISYIHILAEHYAICYVKEIGARSRRGGGGELGKLKRENSLYDPQTNSGPFYGPEKFKLPSLAPFLSCIASLALPLDPLGFSVAPEK
jgi:hypothetical protein